MIEPDESKSTIASQNHLKIRIPKKLIMRTAQAAACLIVVAAIAVGWVAMVRLVGRPGEPGSEGTGDVNNTDNSTEPNPGFHVEVTTNEHGGESINFKGDGGDFDTLKFTGKKVTFYYLDGTLFQDVTAKEMTGEVISDTVYMRSEYLGKSMEIEPIYKNYDNIDILTGEVRTAALAGGSTGIVAVNGKVITELAVSGTLCNMLDAKYLNFTKNYWPENIVSELSIGSKLYFASGNISPNTTAALYMTVFNKSIVSVYGLVNPYDLVKSGDWTLEKMFEMSTSVYTDYDGTATATPADQFGLIATADGINALASTAGIRRIDNSRNPLTLSSTLTNGSAAAFCEKVAAAISSRNAYIISSDIRFTKNTHLVYSITTFGNVIEQTPDIYDSGYDIGFLPLPKYDTGSNYISAISDSAVYYAITTGSDTDMASAVVQYYAFSISDVFHIMWIKYSPDSESYENLQMIEDSMTFDLGRVLASRLGNFASLIPNAVSSGTEGIKNAFSTTDSYTSIISELASTLK